jgi:hypothetical protein
MKKQIDYLSLQGIETFIIEEQKREIEVLHRELEDNFNFKKFEQTCKKNKSKRKKRKFKY